MVKKIERYVLVAQTFKLSGTFAAFSQNQRCHYNDDDDYDYGENYPDRRSFNAF